MIDKKDKEAGYIDLEQPQGVPDVKPITGWKDSRGHNQAQKGSEHWGKYYTSSLFIGNK